jgi:hypothetical protein
MRHATLRSGRVAIVAAALAINFSVSAQPSNAPGNRSPINAEEFDQLFQQVKNWGRWGADDQLGAVNLITAAKRKQALGLAKTGQTVSLVHNPTSPTTIPARSSTR